MAISLPVNAPLTDSQAEVTAKIGSMKSLLELPVILEKNIPKDNQISAYDYLLKILNTMGLTPDTVFNSFLTLVFNQTGTFLETAVIKALAKSIGQNGIQISPYINNSTPTAQQIKSYQASNLTTLNNIISAALPATFLQSAKQTIAQDLVVMMFGQPNTTPNSLNTNPVAVQNLIANAVCGEGMFSLSNPPIVRNEDIEYNKIALLQELQQGQVTYNISCQGVQIQLPANPTFIFSGGGPFTSSASVVSPAQALTNMVQYVNNQVQNINNETNSNQGGKTFHQTLIEKLLSYISTLVQPYLPALYTIINSSLPSTAPTFGASDFGIYSNCDISNDPSNINKKTFAGSIFNSLLKELIKLLLLLAIKYFKRLVVNYFARTALEKQRRKLQKAVLQFETFFGAAEKELSELQQYTAALTTLNGILQG